MKSIKIMMTHYFVMFLVAIIRIIMSIVLD